MFYKLFESSEFKPFYMFVESVFGKENHYKNLAEIRDEFISYKKAFNDNLYKYKPRTGGVKKEDYCLGDDNHLPNGIRTISAVIKQYDTIKTKSEFIKVENEYFSFNSIDISILAINNNTGKKDYTSKFLKCIFKYFGLDYEDLHKYRKEKNTKEIKIKQKWLGLIAYFSYKYNTNELLSKYPLLENEALLFIIDYIIDNYSNDLIKTKIDMIDNQIRDLILSVKDMIYKLSVKENEISEMMDNSFDNFEKYFTYNSYYNQLKVYKKILHSIFEIINDECFYNQTNPLKGFLIEGSNDMNTLTKILMNQLITVKFLTKLYGKIFNANIFFDNSFDTIIE